MEKKIKTLIKFYQLLFIVVFLFTISATLPHADGAAEMDAGVDAVLIDLLASEPVASEPSKIVKGIVMYPDVLKTGLVVGGKFGEESKTVNYYNTVVVSHGLQAGVQ